MRRYCDKHGNELHAGDVVRWDNGREEVLYAWRDGGGEGLGVDATNPVWVEQGRAYQCQFGVFPLTDEDLAVLELA